MEANDTKKTMLIVDDISENGTLLNRVFGAEYCIEEADTAESAIKRLYEFPEVSVLVLDITTQNTDAFAILSIMREDSRLYGIPTVVIASDDEQAQIRALKNGATDVICKPFNPQIIYHRVKNIAARKEADILAEENRAYAQELRLSDIDEKTGLFNKHAFIRYTKKLLLDNPDKEYVIMRWDIDNFKVYNDCFGTECGDEYLHRVGEYYIRHGSELPGLKVYARYDADHFVCCYEADKLNLEAEVRDIDSIFAENKKIPFEYTARVGLYKIHDKSVDVVLMCDRALLALRSVKNRYDHRYAWYDDEMRRTIREEQDIVNEMECALDEGQFVIYLQPQYNHDADALVGAEALVRWNHPKKGLLSPAKFLPLFERNGFISKLDKYIWEQVCVLLRKWKDMGLCLVPISVNISRRDIYSFAICEIFSSLLKEYGLEPSLVHLEITETAYTQNSEQLINTVSELRRTGLNVHMDDFGSGYSSLNVLRNVPVDMLKLDMKFLDSSISDDRGGSILNAVLRMADALRLPVIAEGVETKEQAELLKSIGCFLMQGYYFARPMPVSEFEALLKQSTNCGKSAKISRMTLQSAFLWSGIIGGASMMQYDRTDGTASAVRVNEQYLKELRITRTEYLHRSTNIFENYDADSRRKIEQMLRLASETGEETTCEVQTCTKEITSPFWIRLRARLVSAEGSREMFCLSIENIDERKLLELRNSELAEQFTALCDSMPGGVINLEISGSKTRTVFFSDTTASMSGYSSDEYSREFSDNPLKPVYAEDKDAIEKSIRKLCTGECESFCETYRHRCKNGQLRWVETSGRVIRRRSDSILVNFVVTDVNSGIERERTNRFLTEHNRLLSSAEGSIAFDYDPASDRLVFSMNIPGMGFTEEIYEHYLNDFGDSERIAEEDRDGYINALKEAARNNTHGIFEYKADFLRCGYFRRYRNVYLSVPNESGVVMRILGRVDDIEDEALKQGLSLAKSQIDSATGLLNSPSARAVIERILCEKPTERYDALIIIDTDKCEMSERNRSMRETANILKRLLRADDIVSRYGCVGFLIYMRSANKIESVRKKVIELLSALRPVSAFSDESTEYYVGISDTEIKDASFELLMSKAEEALDACKKEESPVC